MAFIIRRQYTLSNIIKNSKKYQFQNADGIESSGTVPLNYLDYYHQRQKKKRFCVSQVATNLCIIGIPHGRNFSFKKI